MRRYLPSLTAMKTFEAAARHKSFTGAAEELGVTQGAVSRQVRLLEDRLGLRLFRRGKRHLELTKEGLRYMPPLTRALNMMEAATIDVLASRAGTRILKISMLPTFAMQWLVPRLTSFRQENPRILVSLYTSNRLVDLVAENFDLAIRYGDGKWENLMSEPLLDEDVVVVCAPELLEGRTSLRDPKEILNYMILHTVTRRAAWPEWMSHAGGPIDDVPNGIEFEDFFMTIQGALAGLGIAVLPQLLVQDHLNDGSLIKAYPVAAPSKASYHVVGHPARWEDPAVTAFRSWIQDQANGCARST